MEVNELINKLKNFKDMKIEEVDKDKIDDLENIKINRRKSRNERILDFLKEVNNPYIFKVDGRLVKFEYLNNGDTAENCLTKVIKSLYQ